MTQEEKQILLKDLCARQFYGTKVLGPWEKDGPCELSAIDLTSSRQIRVFEDWFKIEEVKPYLRPMSSMTEEELMEFGQLKYQDNEIWEIVEMRVVKHDFLNIKCRNRRDGVSTWVFQISRTEPLRSWKGIDWLNEHYFDFRGLIPMGLALEAPEDMYETE